MNEWTDNLKEDQEWRLNPYDIADDFASGKWKDDSKYDTDGFEWKTAIFEAVKSRIWMLSDNYNDVVDLDDKMTKGEIRSFLTGIPSSELTKKAETFEYTEEWYNSALPRIVKRVKEELVNDERMKLDDPKMYALFEDEMFDGEPTSLDSYVYSALELEYPTLTEKQKIEISEDADMLSDVWFGIDMTDEEFRDWLNEEYDDEGNLISRAETFEANDICHRSCYDGHEWRLSGTSHLGEYTADGKPILNWRCDSCGQSKSSPTEPKSKADTHDWEMTKTKNWGDGVFTIYAECKRCGVKGYADGDVEESIDIQHPSLRAETFEAKGDCAECYGTGGLYDSHMGINDECHSCGGTGFDY